MPHERLAAWLLSLGWNDMEAGFRLGCDRSYLPRLRRGERLPGRRLANMIERLSAPWEHGPIRSTEWDELEAQRACEVAE